MPVNKLEEIEEESDEEKTLLTKSKIEEEESSDEIITNASVMDISRIAKLRVVKGLNKSKTYKLKDDGYTNIEA